MPLWVEVSGFLRTGNEDRVCDVMPVWVEVSGFLQIENEERVYKCLDSMFPCSTVAHAFKIIDSRLQLGIRLGAKKSMHQLLWELASKRWMMADTKVTLGHFLAILF